MRERRLILPWVVWGVAVSAYMVATINRASLSALGPATQEHFGIEATTLSMFAVIQLIVYSGMQIPVGMLLDRYGSTVLILIGGVLMMLGQIAMATVADVRLAILARILVGAGDACTFTSVIRLLPDWFAVRQLPTISQVTGLVGGIGQLISVAPLALVVSGFGWATGFIGIAAVGFIFTLLHFFVLRDWPGQGTAAERIFRRVGKTSRDARSLAGHESTTELLAIAPPPTEMFAVVGNELKKEPKREPKKGPNQSVWKKLRALISIPGVRLAFWLHFSTPFSINVMVLLWGTPFFTGGAGVSVASSAGLLSIAIVAGMVAGLTMGPITSRFVERRVRVVLVVIVVIVVAWLAALFWPGSPPYGMLLVLVLIVPIGGPASMVAFEVVRSHAPRSYLGLATGMVNMGGFVSSLLVMLFIGLALDAQGAGSPEDYSMTAFRFAMLTQVPVWLLGFTMMLIEKRRTENWMSHHGRKLR